MKFTRVDLMLDSLETDRIFRSDFAFQNKFIGNYLRRHILQLKFQTIDFNRVAIVGCQKTVKENYFFEKVLITSVLFDKTKYDNLPKDQLPDFFIDMYIQGILKAKSTHDIPAELIINQLKIFKENNYINEWEYKSKTFKEIGVKATLFCKMTIDYFSLSLILRKKNEIIFCKEILNTLPDEIMYHYKFKHIEYKNNEIKVIDAFNEPLYTLDLSFKV